MTEDLFVRFEEVDPPRVRFRVEGLLHPGEPFPLDARFALRVILEAFSVMERGSFPHEGQPSEPTAVRSLMDRHPMRAILLHSTSDAMISDPRYVAALAADFVTEVAVKRHAVSKREDGKHEIATYSVRLLSDLAFHCASGFHWISKVTRSQVAG